MKIIVASFPKTGTKTLNAALTILGYRVYDYLEHAYYHNQEWLKILKIGHRKETVELFRQMYKDVDVVLDIPAYQFWEEISEAFPEAKILLTLRDEEDYYRSAQKQIAEINNDWKYRLMKTITPTGRRVSRVIINTLPVTFGYQPAFNWSKFQPNETVLRMRFRQHNAYVLKRAPQEKLLVFRLKDGWGPLCKFLGLEEPNVEFPQKNKNGSLIAELSKENEILMQMNRELTIVSYCVLTVFAVIMFLMFL